MIYGGDLPVNNIFIYGSNVDGWSKSGSAKTAVDHYGAIYGNGYGLQGQSYGIATIDLKKGLRSTPLEEIKNQLIDFIKFAIEHPELTFWMTKIGTNLAGYTLEEIRSLFFELDFPYNVALPIEFCETYEIERSFLIKSIPQFFKLHAEVSFIQQYYTENGDRFRIQQYKSTGKYKYFKTVKTKVAAGIYKEDEIEISMEDIYPVLQQKNLLLIEKQRHEISNGDIHFCIDEFFKFPMLKMEIESIGVGEYSYTKKKIFEYNPSFLKEILIYETTGIKAFSNRSLAWKIQ